MLNELLNIANAAYPSDTDASSESFEKVDAIVRAIVFDWADPSAFNVLIKAVDLALRELIDDSDEEDDTVVHLKEAALHLSRAHAATDTYRAAYWGEARR